MAATNFKTENNTFRKLIGNGLTYSIPRFQRDYSWTSDEWEDLWMDLQGTLQPGGELAHYMGYLVLQSSDDRTFEVIDGQQRLTTISLIVLAALKNLQRLIESGQEADSNQRRMEQIRQTYIGYLDPVTLVARPKLTLNRNNNDYYQHYLVPLGPLPQRGFRASEHLLRKAFEWFDGKVADLLKKNDQNGGVILARFVEDLSDRLFFTVITVTDELNAYKVFETLNARGVRLSATDLLKNYLFSVLDKGGGHNDHELKTLEGRWENMVGRLGAESYPDFLRIHWNSRNSFVRQIGLFKTIREQVRSRKAVFDLVREMEEDLDTYLNLFSPEASSWSTEIKNHASTLKTFNVRQPYPLLLAAKRRFDESSFTGIMRACVVISLRYNIICGYTAAEQESVYNATARKISRGDISELKSALDAMQNIYPNDRSFRDAFAEKAIRTTQSRNNRLVRYILCALEKQLSGQDYSFGSDSFNIEHILPQKPETGWQDFSDEEVEALVYRLGNMTLMETGMNRTLSNEPYDLKRESYLQSGFMITKKLAEENAEWTPDRIAARQNQMASHATTIWRIAQLS